MGAVEGSFLCISAGVSFSLSGVLLLTGAYCVGAVMRADRRLLPLAVIPLLFGIQQFFEGLVWLGLDRSDPALVKAVALVYLFFALCFWPVWVPFSTMFIEARKSVRRWLWAAMAVGAALGACLYGPIVTRPDWVIVKVVGHSIHYDISASPLQRVLGGALWLVVYVAIVTVPFLVSPIRRLFNFGLAAVLSAAASMVLFPSNATSVWCLFAAALSLYLSGLFYRLPRRVVGGVGAGIETP